MSAAMSSGQRRRFAEAEAERAKIRHQTFYDRLVWVHGPDRAEAIIDGKDAVTNADIAKWRSLGRVK